MVAWWTCVATLVFFGGHLLEKKGEQPMPGEPSKDQLLVPFSRAQLAVGGVPVDEAVVLHHRGMAVFLDGQFRTVNAAPVDIARMEQEFVSQGWVLREETRSNAGGVYAKLCQRGIALIADSRNSFGDGGYYLAAIWALDKKHYAYCDK